MPAREAVVVGKQVDKIDEVLAMTYVRRVNIEVGSGSADAPFEVTDRAGTQRR